MRRPCQLGAPFWRGFWVADCFWVGNYHLMNYRNLLGSYCLMRRKIMAQNNKGRFDSFGEVLLTSFFDHGSHAIITQQPLPGSSRRGPGSSLFCVDRQQPCLAFAFGSSTAPPGAARDPPVRPRYCDCRSAGERQGHPMRAHRRRLWGRAPLHG